MRSKCATSLPDKVNPISGTPARPAASSDLSYAAPAVTNPTRPALPSGAAPTGLACRSSRPSRYLNGRGQRGQWRAMAGNGGLGEEEFEHGRRIVA